MKNRFRGAILSLACGDALGAPAEFLTRTALAARYGRITDMESNHIWDVGEWTDDTALTLCVAQGILTAGVTGDPVPTVGERFVAWYRSVPKDVGATIRSALSGFRGDWTKAAQNTLQAQTRKAAGNGSLMRTLPVALVYRDETQMLTQSARISAMTHWDAEAETCSAVYSLWIRNLLAGQERRDAWNTALLRAQERIPDFPATSETPGLSSVSAPLWERLSAAPNLAEADLQPSGYAGYVVECLEAAAWHVIAAATLEETLIGTANMAGESDTIGAVAGGAAGAFWGATAIPARWLDVLYERDELEAVADALLTLRQA